MPRYSVLISLIFIAPAAFAQTGDDPWSEESSVWQMDWQAAATLAAQTDVDDSVRLRAFVSGEARYTFDSGLEAGAAGTLEIQADHPARAGFSGTTGFLSPLTAPIALTPGAFSGLSEQPTMEDIGPRGAVSTAYVFVTGGYGEARLGLGEGVGARFSVAPPSLFKEIAIGSARLDPSGRDFIRVRHDLTGPSAKLSLTTPRLVGLQAGLSYTPEADQRGLDRDTRRSIGVASPYHIENITEIAVSLDRGFGPSWPRLEAGLAWSQAGAFAPDFIASGPSDGFETWSAGVKLVGDRLSAGVSWLDSENGVVANRNYEAVSAGVSAELNEFLFGLEYGQAEDFGARVDSTAWRLSARKQVTENVFAVLGWSSQESTNGGQSGPFAFGGSDKTEGIVIEITLSR